MNHCTFTGYLTEDPELDSISEASLCMFKMITYEYRKNKAGQKKRTPTVLTFEAWASGAETIVKLGKRGSKMTVHASARNGPFKTDSADDIIFRVNEFDFGCLDKE